MVFLAFNTLEIGATPTPRDISRQLGTSTRLVAQFVGGADFGRGAVVVQTKAFTLQFDNTMHSGVYAVTDFTDTSAQLCERLLTKPDFRQGTSINKLNRNY